jgi:hypothetical protein
MQRLYLVLGAVATVVSIAAATTSASAGEWGFGCGGCGASYGYGPGGGYAPYYRRPHLYGDYPRPRYGYGSYQYRHTRW